MLTNRILLESVCLKMKQNYLLYQKRSLYCIIKKNENDHTFSTTHFHYGLNDREFLNAVIFKFFFIFKIFSIENQPQMVMIWQEWQSQIILRSHLFWTVWMKFLTYHSLQENDLGLFSLDLWRWVSQCLHLMLTDLLF